MPWVGTPPRWLPTYLAEVAGGQHDPAIIAGMVCSPASRQGKSRTELLPWLQANCSSRAPASLRLPEITDGTEHARNPDQLDSFLIQGQELSVQVPAPTPNPRMDLVRTLCALWGPPPYVRWNGSSIHFIGHQAGTRGTVGRTQQTADQQTGGLA